MHSSVNGFFDLRCQNHIVPRQKLNYDLRVPRSEPQAYAGISELQESFSSLQNIQLLSELSFQFFSLIVKSKTKQNNNPSPKNLKYFNTWKVILYKVQLQHTLPLNPGFMETLWNLDNFEKHTSKASANLKPISP